MMIIRINVAQALTAGSVMAFLGGCSATSPPPLPENNPAAAEMRVPANSPPNVLRDDETTLAVQTELNKTEAAAKSAEQMSHAEMPGMQMSDMKMEDKKGPTATEVQQEKKAIAGEMKKTAEEMEKTSKELERKTEQTKPQPFYYTCPMHPEIHEDKPGKCPKCGMTLVKKEGPPPK